MTVLETALGLLRLLPAREAYFKAYWAHEYGPWHPDGYRTKSLARSGGKPPLEGKIPIGPAHYKPPCADCYAAWLYSDEDRTPCEIARASTLFDTYEVRYYVCEPCWRNRCRGAGWTETYMREILIGQGRFTAAEVDQAFAEDAARGRILGGRR